MAAQRDPERINLEGFEYCGMSYYQRLSRVISSRPWVRKVVVSSSFWSVLYTECSARHLPGFRIEEIDGGRVAIIVPVAGLMVNAITADSMDETCIEVRAWQQK